MLMRKKFVPTYLFSFVVGFVFGELMDLHELWITRLPVNLPLRVLYFVLSYLILCFGIALSKRCKLPIVFGLGRIEGLGIGTVAAAFTMGKGIVLMGKLLDKKFAFVSVLSPERP